MSILLFFGSVAAVFKDRFYQYAQWPNAFAIRKARGNEGVYLPSSLAIIVYRVTPALSASSCWIIWPLSKTQLANLIAESVLANHCLPSHTELGFRRSD